MTSPAVAELTVVEEGEARAVIVVPSASNDLQQIGIADFRETLRRASGADIPGEVVDGYDFEAWRAWQAAGAREIGLRPKLVAHGSQRSASATAQVL